MGAGASVDENVLPGELSEEAAANAICAADALVITSGAGMGVDSGLGTFRGQAAGVWPPLKAMQLDFSVMSRPDWFEVDPRLAWAFWKYRHDAYAQAIPHEGYRLAAQWGESKPRGVFSVTSNIDGHWGRTAGVGDALVYEVHGSVNYVHSIHSAEESASSDRGFQPTDREVMAAMDVPEWTLKAGDAVEVILADQSEGGGVEFTGYSLKETDAWIPAVVAEDGCSILDAKGQGLEVKALRTGPECPDLFRVLEGCPLPQTKSGEPARPAVLMFWDGQVCKEVINAQEQRWSAWKASLTKEARIAILEVGAGVAITTIRQIGQELAEEFPNTTLIRVNAEHSAVAPSLGAKTCSIQRGALEACRLLDGLISRAGKDSQQKEATKPKSNPQTTGCKAGGNSKQKEANSQPTSSKTGESQAKAQAKTASKTAKSKPK